MARNIPVRLAGALAALGFIAGCSTNPITGRDQILALPAVQAVHADVSFALSAGVPRNAESQGCTPDCAGARAGFTGRVATIGARLEASARDLAPDLFGRIEKFQIEVHDSLGAATGSSAGGRIAVGSGLARLEPTDVVVAFLLAREMAHVIARHAEEIAMALLDRAGMPANLVALELNIGIVRAQLPGNEWGARYLESAQRADAIAALVRRDRQAMLERAQADEAVAAPGAGVALESAAFAAAAAAAE